MPDNTSSWALCQKVAPLSLCLRPRAAGPASTCLQAHVDGAAGTADWPADSVIAAQRVAVQVPGLWAAGREVVERAPEAPVHRPGLGGLGWGAGSRVAVDAGAGGVRLFTFGHSTTRTRDRAGMG